jgi:phosphate transport system protein
MVVRIEFQKEMESLHQDIIRMGATVEAAINEAVLALMDLDVERAKKVIDGDDIIDEMEREIDRKCVEIIARQQPVASDLRDVTSTLKLITDLERIADHASDISERILAICEHGERIPVPYDISRIADFAKDMLREALDSYVSRNEEQAARTIAMDDRVDEMFEGLETYLTHLMKVDPQNVEQLVDLLMICKYFERIADHAQNVAEWVLYYIKGRHIKYPNERTRDHA